MTSRRSILRGVSTVLIAAGVLMLVEIGRASCRDRV